MIRNLVCLLLISTSASIAGADERLKDIACRSVHLGYTAPEGVVFYNEMTVDQSAAGTYFMACGFRMGYFGIQELANGKKVVIFSVWEPGRQNDAKAAPKDRRVQMLAQGKDVRVRRFGGEGTGGQSFFDYDWKNGETCRFLVRAQKDGDRTAFAGYFYLPKEKSWKHLVTFSTLANGKLLHGYYSFVEDFRRNRISATQVRKAHFENGWVFTTEKTWQPLTQARFTADSNPALNIDAGNTDDRFFLATGGTTKNAGTKLRSRITLASKARKHPSDLPDWPKPNPKSDSAKTKPGPPAKTPQLTGSARDR